MFTTHFRELVLKRGLKTGKTPTQQEISSATGITQAALSRWNQGSISQLDYVTVRKLMDYFDCEFHELITVDRSQPDA